MSRSETFEVEVGPETVHGWLRTNGGSRPSPAVLILADPPGSALDHASFIDELAEGLHRANLAVAQFEPRLIPSPNGGDAGGDAGTIIDGASAVFRWMLLREDLDAQRLGLFSTTLGAIFAAGLAGRTDQIDRLCLFAPATAEEALSRLARPNGDPPLLDPDAVNETYLASLGDLDPPADLARHERTTLVIQGAADRVVGADSGRAYVTAVERAGHEIEHELVAGADHDPGEPELRAVCLDRITRFFTR